jgi:hypothetical protein
MACGGANLYQEYSIVHITSSPDRMTLRTCTPRTRSWRWRNVVARAHGIMSKVGLRSTPRHVAKLTFTRTDLGRRYRQIRVTPKTRTTMDTERLGCMWCWHHKCVSGAWHVAGRTSIKNTLWCSSPADPDHSEDVMEIEEPQRKRRERHEHVW